MTQTSNQKKNAALGMAHGTANSRLRKSVLFYLVQMLGLDICYQCDNIIETIDEFSIEHKISWQGSANPKEAFFDLNNIAFSHLVCNVRAGERPLTGFKKGHTKERFPVSEGMAWCGRCRAPKPLEAFSKNRNKWNGVQDICISCRSAYRSPKCRS